jgi:tetratricopeptide (TPR) repeat protein
MLFELGGKRKRLIQVIYVCLAFLMFVALVGFGIGGGTSGGIFDALGIGGGSNPSSPQYDAQIQRAEDTLATNPKDEKALITLARTHFLAGQAATSTGDQGQVQLTEETLTEYRKATDAWERYLNTKPKQPDDGVASLMLQAYTALAGSDPAQIENDIDQAYKAAQIVAEARPSFGTYLQLATYAYYAGDEKVGAEATQKALKEAPDSTSKGQVKTQIKQAKAQGAAIAKAIKKSAPDQSQLQNPLGGLGSSSSAVPGG